MFKFKVSSEILGYQFGGGHAGNLSFSAGSSQEAQEHEYDRTVKSGARAMNQG